ncbi:MAG: type III PLP-dependent enzyme [Magnetococcales bacterium]|nr:type III PLP-dependent enzyme [Magnetococcales bacterium]
MDDPPIRLGEAPSDKQRLAAVAASQNGPFYLYDLPRLLARIHQVKEALGSDFRLYYAMKANPNAELVRAILSHCDGLDISSAGELSQALRVGAAPATMSFAGPGKTATELKQAIAAGIGSISIESFNELQRVQNIASGLGRVANISLRVNPAQRFPAFAIKMGGRPCQFGIDEEQLPDFISQLTAANHCRLQGLHVYSGTQCLDEETLVDNLSHTLKIATRLIQESGRPLACINFGGGFGVDYHPGQKPLSLAALGPRLRSTLARFKDQSDASHLIGIIELGRFLVAQVGVYIARITDIKVSRGETFCILEGGMNHHLAASGHFGQVIRKNFRIINVSAADGSPRQRVTLVGPLCTSLDLMGDRVELDQPEIGHAIAFLDSGAYGLTASPLGFLSHPPPAELLWDRQQNLQVIRPSTCHPVLVNADTA